MDSYEHLSAAFQRRMACIAGAVDILAPGIEAAVTKLIGAVMEDRKILLCGCGTDKALVEHMAQTLRCPDPPPSLPAIAIIGDGEPDVDASLWRDLRTLSRDGDVLLALDTRDGAAFAQISARFAQERNLSAIILSQYLEPLADSCVVLEAEDQSLRSELALMATHCLREQIRHQLLGE